MVSVIKIKTNYVRDKVEGKKALDNILLQVVFLDPVLVPLYQHTEAQREEGCQYTAS